jgi:hypothetical protein
MGWQANIAFEAAPTIGAAQKAKNLAAHGDATATP